MSSNLVVFPSYEQVTAALKACHEMDTPVARRDMTVALKAAASVESCLSRPLAWCDSEGRVLAASTKASLLQGGNVAQADIAAYDIPLGPMPLDGGVEARRYRALCKAGLPLTFMGVRYETKEALDLALDRMP